MKPWRAIGVLALCNLGCMSTTHERNVLRTDKQFKPQGMRRVATDVELVIGHDSRLATLQHPARCDGVIRHTEEIETIEQTRPTVSSYIASGLLMAVGLVALERRGPDTSSLVFLGVGGGLLGTVVLASDTKRSIGFEQRWLPQRDHPCGGMPIRYQAVRVGVGAAAVERTTDADGRFWLPGYLVSGSELPAAFVDDEAIPVRLAPALEATHPLELTPQPSLPSLDEH